jgi:hypothetical protein
MLSHGYRPSGRALQTLTDDQLRQRAPSIFATEAHESRSARYAYIPTLDILAGLRGQGFQPVQVTQSRCRIPGKAAFTKHQIKFTHDDATAIVARVGDVVPQIILKNSHDGSSAYELSLGLYRYVCANGLMVCDGAFSEIKVKHQGDVRNNVIEGAFQVIQSAGEVAGHVDAFKATALSHQEQEALARQAIALRFDVQEGETAPIEPSRALAVRRSDDAASDLWSTYNVLQENLVKGGQRYIIPARQATEAERERTGRSYVRAKRMHTREVKGIDQNTSLNRALWRLAEEMRALKQAA